MAVPFFGGWSNGGGYARERVAEKSGREGERENHKMKVCEDE